MRYTVSSGLFFGMSALLVSGCGSIPVVDNSPRSQAAVRIETVNLSGSQGYFAYEGTQTTWTRNKQRRVQQRVDFTESALGSFGAGAQRAYLFDLDVPKLQQVDYDAKLYHQCDMLGCFEFSEASRTVEPQLPVFDGQSCDISVGTSQLTLEPDAQEAPKAGGLPFRFVWQVELQDAQGRTGSSLLHGILWLSDEPGGEAQAIERGFQKAYSNAVNRNWPVLDAYLPPVTLALVEQYFLSTLDANTRSRTLMLAHPNIDRNVVVAGNLKWQAAGPACGYGQPDWQRRKAAAAGPTGKGTQSATENIPPADGIETFGDFLSAMASELASEQPGTAPGYAGEEGEPETVATPALPFTLVFTYAWEVETLVMGEVSANQLAIPADFKSGTRF